MFLTWQVDPYAIFLTWEFLFLLFFLIYVVYLILFFWDRSLFGWWENVGKLYK